MGLYSSKIDRDTAKNVKIQILKNDSFLFKNCVFLNENCHFSKFYDLHFLLYFGQFLNYIGPIYHFGILKVSSITYFFFEKSAMNDATEIDKKRCLLF